MTEAIESMRTEILKHTTNTRTLTHTHITQVCVVGLKEYNVEDVGIVKQLIESANQQRSVGTTAANSDSSRSHSIMQFALKSGADKMVGKLSFIDLAGVCHCPLHCSGQYAVCPQVGCRRDGGQAVPDYFACVCVCVRERESIFAFLKRYE